MNKKILVEMDDTRFSRKMKNATSAVKYAMRMFRKHGLSGEVYQTEPGYFPLMDWDDRKPGWRNLAGFENREWFEWCEKSVNEEPLQPGDWCYEKPVDPDLVVEPCNPKDRITIINGKRIGQKGSVQRNREVV